MNINSGLLLLVGLLHSLLLVLLLRLFGLHDVGLSLLLRHHSLLHLKELIVHVDLLLLVLLLLLQLKVLLLIQLLHGLLMLIHLIRYLIVRYKLIEQLLGWHHSLLLLTLPIRQVLLQVVQLLEVQLKLLVLLLVTFHIARLIVLLLDSICQLMSQRVTDEARLRHMLDWLHLELLLLLLERLLLLLLFVLRLNVTLDHTQVEVHALLPAHILTFHGTRRVNLIDDRCLLLLEIWLSIELLVSSHLLLRLHHGLLLLLLLVQVVTLISRLLTDSLVNLSGVLKLLHQLLLLVFVGDHSVKLTIGTGNRIELLAVSLEDNKRVRNVELRLLHVEVEKHVLMIAHLVHFSHLLSQLDSLDARLTICVVGLQLLDLLISNHGLLGLLAFLV